MKFRLIVLDAGQAKIFPWYARGCASSGDARGIAPSGGDNMFSRCPQCRRREWPAIVGLRLKKEIAALLERHRMRMACRTSAFFTPSAAIQLCTIRKRNSRWTKTSRASSRSRCSVTEPTSEFSMGITAAATDPRCSRSKTSAERAQATMLPSRDHTPRRFLAERTCFPLDGKFHLSNLAGLRRGKQILLEHERVHAVGVVPGNGLHQKILVSLVERERRLIVHRRLQIDEVAARRPQAIFRRAQQL